MIRLIWIFLSVLFSNTALVLVLIYGAWESYGWLLLTSLVCISEATGGSKPRTRTRFSL